MTSTSLTALPEEMIAHILELLETHTTALHAICLSGDRTLLRIAQPLAWRHPHFNVVSDLPEHVARFKAFCGDERRAAAVRTIKITIRDPLHAGATDFAVALRDNLSKFVNVFHAHLDCCEFNSTFEWIDDYPRCVIEALPALESIRVDGLSGLIYRDDNYPLNAPLLRKVESRFCDPELDALWTIIPQLEELVMVSGYGQEWWSTRAHPPDHVYRGYVGWQSGTISLLELLFANQAACQRMRKLVLYDTYRDGWFMGEDVAEFFKELSTPLDHLECLVLDYYFDLNAVLDAFFAVLDLFPALRAFKLSWNTREQTHLNVLQSIERGLDDHMRSQQCDRFEELGLPSLETSADYEQMSKILAHMTALQHLYLCPRPGLTPAIEMADVARLGTGSRHLRSITMEGMKTTYILPKNAGNRCSEEGIVVGDYRRPPWTIED